MAKKKRKKASKASKNKAPAEPPLHIVGLRAENVMRLTAVHITPDGKPLVIVSGKNGAGKSAVLNTIEFGLAGKRAQPPRPVREGTDEADIVLDLGDLVVHRTITTSGSSSLVVTGKDGAVFKAPQALLDRLTGQRAFDPLAFLALSPAEQKTALQRLVGLDLSDLDWHRRELLDAIQEQRRLHTTALETAKAMMTYPDAPVAQIAVADLVGELEAAQARQIENDNERQGLAHARADLQGLRDQLLMQGQRVDELKAQIEAATNAYADAVFKLDAQTDTVQKSAARVAALEDPELDAICDRIAHADATNEHVRANQERDGYLAAARGHQGVMASKRAEIAEIDAERAKRLAATEFPVPGLAFTEDGVSLKGLPFVQAARSEQIEVCVAMGLAEHPRLAVMLVREGNDLDPEHVALLAKLAEEHGARIWLEQHTPDPDRPASVVIVDGHVKGQEVCTVCSCMIDTDDPDVTICAKCVEKEIDNAPDA